MGIIRHHVHDSAAAYCQQADTGFLKHDYSKNMSAKWALAMFVNTIHPANFYFKY